MSSTLKWILGVIGAVIIAVGLFLGGMFTGRALLVRDFERAGNYYGMPGGAYPGGVYGPGMMGGTGMMGDYGMMDGVWGSRAEDAEPLSIDQASQAVQETIDTLDDENLELGEVMIFDNHAYAQIIESDTGMGAMEVLVDPVTLDVYPEYGPNMMWNQRYGHMGSGRGYGMGGMMGGWTGGSDDGEMSVSPEQAVEIAQNYLDEAQSGAQADEHADAFYGYYTLHVLEDGEVAGMLSVNGTTGDVFPHTWHGNFVEMSGE